MLVVGKERQVDTKRGERHDTDAFCFSE